MPVGVEGCEVRVGANHEEICPSVVPGARKARVPHKVEGQASKTFHGGGGKRSEQRVGEARVSQV